MINFFENFLKTRKITKFNSNLFGNKFGNTKKILLCEISHNKVTQTAFSYLINGIIKKENCKCFGYLDISKMNFFGRIKILIHKIFKFNFGNFSIFKSFNVKNFIFLQENKFFRKKTLNLINSINFKNKSDLLSFKIDNILIGDLVYDTYLKDTGNPTINLNDPVFQSLLIKTINIFYYWKFFFDSNEVVAVIISDSVYTNSMVSRISSYKKISTYQCNWNNICRIDKKNFHAYSKFHFYKKDFESLSKFEQTKAMEITKKRINMRLRGSTRIDDQIYTGHTSWHLDFGEKRILTNSKKKKILIASHGFIDAPHCYGPESIIFPDFYEWLIFLDKISKETDYEWYIKAHPHAMEKDYEILKKFLKDRPHLFELPKQCTHNQLINEGINCVLTVYGTIAWEYAYFEIPVISASKNNPHINYNFCVHAQNINEYEKMIKNFDDLKIDFNKKKIYEFYFMHNIFSRSNWLFNNHEKIMSDIQGYDNLAKFRFYEYWIANFDKNKKDSINKNIHDFLNTDHLYIKNKNILQD